MLGVIVTPDVNCVYCVCCIVWEVKDVLKTTLNMTMWCFHHIHEWRFLAREWHTSVSEFKQRCIVVVSNLNLIGCSVQISAIETGYLHRDYHGFSHCVQANSTLDHNSFSPHPFHSVVLNIPIFDVTQSEQFRSWTVKSFTHVLGSPVRIHKIQ